MLHCRIDHIPKNAFYIYLFIIIIYLHLLTIGNFGLVINFGLLLQCETVACINIYLYICIYSMYICMCMNILLLYVWSYKFILYWFFIYFRTWFYYWFISFLFGNYVFTILIEIFKFISSKSLCIVIFIDFFNKLYSTCRRSHNFIEKEREIFLEN